MAMFITGDDVWDGSATLVEAEERCTNTTSCLGFTFNGPLNPAGSVNVFLKSAINFVPAPGWQTYVSSRVSEGSERPSHPSTSNAIMMHAHSHNHPHGKSQSGAHHEVHDEIPQGARRRLRTAPEACFSPPVPVSASGLRLEPGGRGIQFAVLFENNDRNSRLLLPLPLQLTWAAVL
jgi:hypothetical protein